MQERQEEHHWRVGARVGLDLEDQEGQEVAEERQHEVQQVPEVAVALIHHWADAGQQLLMLALAELLVHQIDDKAWLEIERVLELVEVVVGVCLHLQDASRRRHTRRRPRVVIEAMHLNSQGFLKIHDTELSCRLPLIVRIVLCIPAEGDVSSLLTRSC